MDKLNKLKIGGTLSIIAGGLSVLVSITIVVLAVAMAYLTIDTASESLTNLQILIYVAMFLLGCGIMAILGGIFALRRREWWLALTGAICATVTCALIGIPALILITLEKKEFNKAGATPL